jgi:hypothetical protein
MNCWLMFFLGMLTGAAFVGAGLLLGDMLDHRPVPAARVIWSA